MHQSKKKVSKRAPPGSLLKLMFGDTQMSALLANMIQAALMLRYNKRKVG